MEIKEFAETYFKEIDIKISKHQQEFIDNIKDGRKIVFISPKYAGRKTLHEMWLEYLKEIKQHD